MPNALRIYYVNMFYIINVKKYVMELYNTSEILIYSIYMLKIYVVINSQ